MSAALLNLKSDFYRRHRNIVALNLGSILQNLNRKMLSEHQWDVLGTDSQVPSPAKQSAGCVAHSAILGLVCHTLLRKCWLAAGFPPLVPFIRFSQIFILLFCNSTPQTLPYMLFHNATFTFLKTNRLLVLRMEPRARHGRLCCPELQPSPLTLFFK